MTGIDEVDQEILQLLMEDASRSYREIAEQTGRSPPTVSSRIERLRDIGIIRRFTLDIDRSKLVEDSTLLVELDVEPGSDEVVADALIDAPAIEYIIRTIDATVVFVAHTSEQGVRDLLSEALDGGRVRDYSVRLVSESDWKPRLDKGALSIECAVCGKSVDSGGVSIELGERTYDVCCSSCATDIEAQYDEHQAAANE